jgi:hypothetical protein
MNYRNRDDYLYAVLIFTVLAMEDHFASSYLEGFQDVQLLAYQADGSLVLITASVI